MTDEALESPGRRERRKAQTRARVLDVARVLFAKHAYETVTIRMIADEAGIAVGSVFTTFVSKSDMLAAIVAEEISLQGASLDAALVGVEGVANRLRAAFAAMYDFHDRQTALLLQGLSHSWVRDPEAEQAVRRALVPTMRRLESILVAGCEAGEIADDADLRIIVEVLFAAFIANYRGAAFDGWSAADMAARMDRQIAAVLRGALLTA